MDLGGGLKHVLFSSLPRQMIPFDEHIFSDGLKPATSGCLDTDFLRGNNAFPWDPVILSENEQGVSNDLLSIVFRFHYHSLKVIRSLHEATLCVLG